MDEDDFDQILQTDFHPNVHTGDHHHLHLEESHAHDEVDVQAQARQLEAAAASSSTIDPALHDSSSLDRQEETPIIIPPIRRFMTVDPGSHLTADEKKQKQREQNRLAANRSRRKKQGQLGELEGNVEALQRENERLRARLNALSAGQAESSSPFTDNAPIQAGETSEPDLTIPDIDHRYFRKVAQDIQYLKESLIGRETELQHQRASGAENHPPPDAETTRLRGELTQKLARLTMLRSEEKAIQGIIDNLVAQGETLGKDKEKFSRELQHRSGRKDFEWGDRSTRLVEDEEEDGDRGPVRLSRALVDALVWIDEALAIWRQDGKPAMAEAEISLDPQWNEQASTSA